ncbi:hypothetical protein Q5P01_005941 [Channa striata]|uniref:RING-type domain-containing protein n=1 Tax=Channa striata TaxID=64152 RepID=A0AA88NKB0_CHASR|nr:hypothetical protein Q5P01_005941 [Channa striata]
MDSDQEDAEVFSDAEEPSPLVVIGEGDDGDEDAGIFSAWMQWCREGEQRTKIGEEDEEEEESEGGRTESRSSSEGPVQMRTDRRASLPCPSALSAMQLPHRHSSTQAPVTARTLLRRSSSRRLLSSPQEVVTSPLERRPYIIPTIPEALPPEGQAQFRRRAVMSLSDADRVCLICHNDLNRGAGSTRELQCTHTFHRECIEERLWRKQSCPTCHVQVSMPKPVYWSSTRIKVP